MMAEQQNHGDSSTTDGNVSASPPASSPNTDSYISEKSDISAEVNSHLDEFANISDASMYHHYQAPIKCPRRCKVFNVVLLAVAGAVVALVTVLVITNKRTSNVTTPSGLPTSQVSSPTQSPVRAGATKPPASTAATPVAVPTFSPAKETALRLEEFRSFLLNQSVSSYHDLHNTSSPQYQALTWLAEINSTNLTLSPLTTSMDTIQNRYILAAVYFANNGATWFSPCNFLSADSICLWRDSTNDTGVFCDPFELHLGLNELHGTILSEIGKLSNLKMLDLAINGFSGTIPSEIGSLTELEILYLNDNGLNSSIPSELGQLTRLQQLDLHFNYFIMGSLPTELGMLTDLTNFDINNNTVTGTIPTELGKLTNMEYLGLAFNKLDGTIPTEFGLLGELRYLDLQFNSLNGTVPNSIAALANLSELYLDGNEFWGNLTPDFCDRSRVTQWDHIDADCPNKIACECCTKCFKA